MAVGDQIMVQVLRGKYIYCSVWMKSNLDLKYDLKYLDKTVYSK